MCEVCFSIFMQSENQKPSHELQPNQDTVYCLQPSPEYVRKRPDNYRIIILYA